MGSFWDGNDDIRPMETNPVADCAHTQPIGTPISSPPSSDGKAEFGDASELVQDTEPFDDTAPVDDAFETQVLNLAGETQVEDFGCGETQVMDFCGETQVMDFGGETQEMDFGGETQVLDDNCIENMDTQILEFDDEVVSDTDSEKSDTTEVLDDNEYVTDDESVRRGSGLLFDEEKIRRNPCENSERGLREQPNHSTDEQHNAGLDVSTSAPVDEGSPELKLASLQASGLTTRRTALKGTNSESCPVPSYNHSSEQLARKDNAVSLLRGSTIDGEEVNQEHDLGRCNENNRRIGGSTARKLFTEDSDTENEGFLHNSNSGEEGEDLLQFPCDVAGLSYINSQEPGDLSQANALDFVDKFLENNRDEFDKEVDRGKIARESSKHVSSAKGPKTLAKKTTDKTIVQDIGIFDWDDNREDEEGGDFFRRRKADFFNGGSHGWRSLPQPHKSRGIRQDEQKDRRKQLLGKNKKTGVIHSDSKLLLHNSKVDEKTAHEDERKHIKNLVSEFDEQFHTDSPSRQSVANVNENDVPGMLNVGVDTQMAAEAMEALFCGEGISNGDASNAHQSVHRNLKSSPEGLMGEKPKNRICSTNPSSRKRGCLSDAGVSSRETRQAKKTRIGAKSSIHSSISPQEYSKNAKKRCETESVITKSKKAKSNAKTHHNINVNRSLEKIPSVSVDLRTEGSIEKHLQQGVGTLTPIARRTRQSTVVNQFKKANNASSDCGEESSYQTKDVVTRKKITSSTGVQTSRELKKKSSKLGPNQSGEVGHIKPSQQMGSDLKFEAISSGIKLDALSFPKQRRSLRNLTSQVYGPDLDCPSQPSVQPDKVGQRITRQKRVQGGSKSICVDIKLTRRTRSSTCGDQNLDGNFAHKSLKGGPEEASLHDSSSHKDGRVISEIINGDKAVGIPDRKSDANPSSATKMRDESPREKCKPSDSACTTPVNSKVPVNDASPVCMGNEYFQQSCKRSVSRPSLLKEIRGLSANWHEPTSPLMDLRKRRDMTDVRVLYSHHLDDDIIKKQKKILARLGVSVASSMADATHFIADQFVRTRNMLEAIAFGKPVVTHLWLQSCGQAGCFIDEKGYILRDNKKEKEFGFNMPASLARACQHPLLEDRKVFITPNTNPGKGIISNLVKAVKGQAVERIGRSALKADKVPDDLLVLSCEEDYEICVPLLEKGAAVYSSELLLNGIVTQKLEYERHRLFTDQVRKTRSTIWLKKDGNKFLPVTKNK